MTPRTTYRQIERLTTHLVEAGLADDQQFPVWRETDVVEVTFKNAEYISAALGGTPYAEVYSDFARRRVFNAKLLDGALIQMMYRFVDGVLRQHRLAFFPAPHLERFERDPESYEADQVYADIVARSTLPLPIRFDYDSRDERHVDLAHPRSHLTLGEYVHCRIPVTAPLTPHRFVDFILRSFYRTPTGDFASALPRLNGSFAESMTSAERGVLHMTVPAEAAIIDQSGRT